MRAAATAPSAISRLPDGGRFVALDSWRGLAALGVAAGHINADAPLFSNPLHSNLALGVDFFFVLSGFVIAGAYGERLSKGFALVRYMVLRWGRIWPLHALIVCLYIPLELFYALSSGGGIVSGREPFSGERDLLALIPTLLLVQAYVYPGQGVWYAPSWSISVEMGLYFLAAVGWRLLGSRAALAAFGIACAALLLLDTGTLALWSTVLRGLAGFGLGVAAWSVSRRVAATAVPRGLLIAAELVAFPAILLAMWAHVPFAVADPLFVLVVLVFAREAGPVSLLLRTRPFVLLGVLSYSLYMVHGMVFGRIIDLLALLQNLVGARWVEPSLGGYDRLLMAPWPATLLALGMLSASLAVAWLAWRFVEWPAREWSRRRAAAMGLGREEAVAPTI